MNHFKINLNDDVTFIRVVNFLNTFTYLNQIKTQNETRGTDE